MARARVRTREEVEEIKIRKKIKFSLVRQQIDLNRELGKGGCPAGRGKVYITSIFEKNGMLSVTRPHLCLECRIRAHLNHKDIRKGKRATYDVKLTETDVRIFCLSKNYKLDCGAFRRFTDEASSLIVKRQPPVLTDQPSETSSEPSSETSSESSLPPSSGSSTTGPGIPPPGSV